MADHVAVGEVDDDEVVLAGVDLRRAAHRQGIGAHLRLQVVGRHFGRGHQQAVFAGERLLAPPVEEEGTWAYFSVSAVWYWRSPWSLSTFASGS